MKHCCIFGNCQAEGLAFFLKKAGFPYTIDYHLNYELILKIHGASPERLLESARRCDLFICQHVSETKHAYHSSEYYVREVIPKNARVINYAYNFNHGQFPLIVVGNRAFGWREIEGFIRDHTDDEVRSAYREGRIDFGLMPRFLRCAAEQARREMMCNLKVAPWLLENRNQRLFINYNHPTSAVFAEMARQVFALTGEPLREGIVCDKENEVGLPCGLPVSRYVSDFWGWKDWDHSLDAEADGHYGRALEHVIQKVRNMLRPSDETAPPWLVMPPDPE